MKNTSITLQIENGNLNNQDVINSSVTIEKEGYYKISVKHEAPEGYKKNLLFINGHCYGEFISNKQTDEKDNTICKTYLKAGKHTIQIQKSWGGIIVKSITISSSTPSKNVQSTFDLVNPNASKECKELMSFFKQVYGTRIITGQHTAASHGPEIDFIYQKTGKFPALRGFDFLSYSLNTETNEPSEHKLIEVKENKGSVEKAIQWYKEKNGIVTFCWHWYAPLGGNDKAFYTENTDFDLEKALIPNTEEYQALLDDMNEIANQLKILRDENVPVLWRPLHEAEGKWFWWGAKGPEAYKKLYHWMFDLFTNEHQLNNLIWVWNAPAPGWYPGEEYVDIVGMDIYVPSGNYGPIKIGYDYIAELTDYKKSIALTENGPIPDPDILIESKTPWLWYMPWYDEFVFDGKNTSFEHLKKVYKHPYCITLDQLPKNNFN